jgi:hypothetical protein
VPDQGDITQILILHRAHHGIDDVVERVFARVGSVGQAGQCGRYHAVPLGAKALRDRPPRPSAVPGSGDQDEGFGHDGLLTAL